MTLMTAREIEHTHGIRYDRVRYLVKTHRIEAQGDTPTCYGSIRSKLYDVKAVFDALATVDARRSNRAIVAHEYLLAHPKRAKHPDTIEVDGRLFALKRWIMREKGFRLHEINHILFYRKIFAHKVPGGAVYDGTAGYYDVQQIMDTKALKRRPNRSRVDAVDSAKTASDHRADGRSLVWIAKATGLSIYAVMKELGIA